MKAQDGGASGEGDFTCRELRDQAIFIVEDVDRYIFGGLQVQWIALKHKERNNTILFSH